MGSRHRDPETGEYIGRDPHDAWDRMDDEEKAEWRRKFREEEQAPKEVWEVEDLDGTDIYAFVGARIRKFREAAKLTQGEAAGRAGMGSRTYLCNLENGRKRASLGLLVRLCKLYNRSIKEVFADDTDP